MHNKDSVKHHRRILASKVLQLMKTKMLEMGDPLDESTAASCMAITNPTTFQTEAIIVRRGKHSPAVEKRLCRIMEKYVNLGRSV